MPDFLRIFAAPDDPVLSLEVRARIHKVDERKKRQFELLLRHFLNSFFHNEMVSSDDEAKAHTLQIAYAIALPGLIVALFLFPPYHFPGGRPYWLQVSDHYFYVLYSFVAVGVGTIFEWDVFFPGRIDVFVFAGLPVTNRNLFSARIAAAAVFLGLFILSTTLLGVVFFPAACDLPSPLRHFIAHFIAVTMSGAFAASLFLAIQGLVLILIGRRFVPFIAPIVQGVCVASLFTILLLFPAMSRYLPELVQSNSMVVRCFPPFWFVGIYERILMGPSALPAFTALARTGMAATLCTLSLAALLYPLAYWRRTRSLIEGEPRQYSRSWWTEQVNFLLHVTVLKMPARRAIHHFITQTLLRTQRHRVYLAMYGGFGSALILASSLLLQIRDKEIHLGFSVSGLKAASPILLFWIIAGLRAAFLSPVNERAGWIFPAITGRPTFDQLAATRNWALTCVTVFALLLLITVHAVAPPELRTARSIAAQLTVAAGLCLLLRDIFFLNVKTLPFTAVQSAHKANLASILIQYLGLFPPLVLITLGVEAWMQTSTINLVAMIVLILLTHFVFRATHRRIVMANSNLLDIDEDEDEFPQRLGLRY